VKAVAAQTLRFKDMIDRVAGQIAADQDEFSERYTQLRELAVGRTQAVRLTAETRARLQEQAQKDQDLVNQRTTHLADLRAQLTRIKAEVDGLLAKQTRVEQQLFATQRAIAQTLEDIYRLEDQLAETERAKYAPKKK
jgi:chromosome segregation ATPase